MSLRDDGYRPAMALGEPEDMLRAQSVALVADEIALAIATLNGGGSQVTALEALERAQDHIAGGTATTHAQTLKMKEDGREVEEEQIEEVDAANVPIVEPPLPEVQGIFAKPTKRRRKKKRRSPVTDGEALPEYKMRKGRRISQRAWSQEMVTAEKQKRIVIAAPRLGEGMLG